MSSKSPVALILGAGANIGQSVVRHFAARGYNIGLVARSVDPTASTDTQLNIPGDFSKTQDVINAFQKITQTFGVPSVVVYNASSSTFSSPSDPLSISLADVERDLAVNVTGAVVAAQQAVTGFAQLPESASKTFIYTGNILNKTNLSPRFISQGMGKSAAAHMIWQASEGYKEKGYKFYYADERKEDGSAKYRVDGDAHAELFWKLAEEDKAQSPWLQTFVKGKGYVNFEN